MKLTQIMTGSSILYSALACLALAVGTAACTTPKKDRTMPFSQDIDQYLWLEDVESPAALSWVRAHNEKTQGKLEQDPRFARLHEEMKKVYLAQDRVPSPGLYGGFVHNFWQDDKNVRGLLRRTPLEEYRKPQPVWETLLDIDELAKRENENWIYKGRSCFPPKYDRCLVFLSRGGKDASTIREFDVPSRRFVDPKDGGFHVPEAKSTIAWLDENTLLVGTNFGPGSLTKSGYSRIIKLWKRGTPLTDARTVFEGDEENVWVNASTMFRPEGNVTLVQQGLTFFTGHDFVYANGELTRLPFPEHAELQSVFQGHALALLRKRWTFKDRTLEAGTLVSFPLAKLGESNPERFVEVAYRPSARVSVKYVNDTRDHLLLVTLDQVRGRIARLDRVGDAWKHETLGYPDHGAVNVVSSDSFTNEVVISYESFLQPSSLYLSDISKPGTKSELLKQAPSRFKADGLVTEQFVAKSKDGTKIPYFVIHRKGASLNGATPTLLYGYGGFEISLTPHYSGALGKAWLEAGGTYVLANIRGGGEFGPAWHQAALKQKRQKAYDDFIAVAEDIIQRGFTSPAHLGIEGGSNGGLLVGAVFTQRPSLFRAVVCSVPLLDMLRFHKLLAGYSWIDEYGNPDDEDMAEVLQKYSPYHNIREHEKYPKVFFVTSTKDDRVHPGHARKMVAKMEELGHEVLYYENIEGGHGGVANLLQGAYRAALEYTYLHRQLFGPAGTATSRR